MSDSTPGGYRRPSFEQLRKQAKELLRAYRAGDEAARNRFVTRNPHPVSLADAQFVLARENGFDTWASLKQHYQNVESRAVRYQRLAEDLVRACNENDADATERLGRLFGGPITTESLRTQVFHRIGVPERKSISLPEALLFVARFYGFDTWESFQAGIGARPSPPVHGLNPSPPFYKIDQKINTIEPFPPLSLRDWDEIFEVMRVNKITGLRAQGQMTDAALARLAQLDLVTSLQLEGCRQVTDAGLRHLADMPGLQRLNLTGCNVTDEGLSVLRQLPVLREFAAFHHRGITDEGLANLGYCEQIERVELLGSSCGDGVIRALAGKPNLRHFKSGDLVTDAGLAWLHQFPVFRRWQGGEPEISLMGFEAEPNYLLLRGQITDQGMATLVGLDGLFALNLDDSRLSISSSGVASLAGLPHLSWLGFDATDETMGAIGELPRLLMLMCQDTRATDAGFQKLSRSRTLEYLWGRRCHGLTGPGFATLADIPSLRGLSVSCLNVDDAALSRLPSFPSLVEFMPMDVTDEGFRHVGHCARLEAVWCMYCRDTGDAATEYLAGLKRLKTYYAGQTRITDRSLEVLSGINTLEELTLWNCAGVTDAGVIAVGKLPRLRELSLQSMPRVSRKAIDSLPAHLRVVFEV